LRSQNGGVLSSEFWVTRYGFRG